MSGPPSSNRSTDAVLVEAARGGNLSAKETLFRRHGEMAAGLAYRLLGDDAELDDVLQDSFTSAFATLDKLQQPQAFVAWLSRIVTGTAIAVIRRRSLLSRLGFVRGATVHLENLVSRDAPPDVVAELRAVYVLIDRLPAEERVVLVLRRVEQMSVEEIVERTGLPLGTVKRRLANATARLESASDRKVTA